MPYRASAPCSMQGCPALAVRAGRCAQHQRKQAERNEAPRESPSARGYDSNWNQTRTRFLRENPYCEICGDPSEEAHHHTELRQGGTNEDSNLVALCHSCHSRITGQGHGWRR
jgi:5-methylcytosine-specific restriction protein A